MSCRCPCDRSIPQYQGLNLAPSYLLHRCACNTCGHSCCNVRIPLDQYYCWVCLKSWKEKKPHKTKNSGRKGEDEDDERKPKRRKAEGVKKELKKKA